MSDFQPYNPSQHNRDTNSLVEQLPPPVELRQLGDMWCVRVREKDLPLAAIGNTVIDATKRLLKLLNVESAE